MCAVMGMMPPAGACAAFGGGATFLGGCARFVRAYMLCQFNAIQRVLAHMMNNIIQWPNSCKMTAYMVCRVVGD